MGTDIGGDILTDTQKLKRAIETSGYKMMFIARELGITRAALYMKINNASSFKVEEMYKLSKMLDLKEDEKDSIFFNYM